MLKAWRRAGETGLPGNREHLLEVEGLAAVGEVQGTVGPKRLGAVANRR